MLFYQQKEIKNHCYSVPNQSHQQLRMKVWCLKHLVYKYVCMCILQDTCMLFTCVLTRFAAFVRKHIVTEQEMNIIHFVVEFGVFFASMLFCALSKPACVFIEQMQSCQSQSY